MCIGTLEQLTELSAGAFRVLLSCISAKSRDFVVGTNISSWSGEGKGVVSELNPLIPVSQSGAVVNPGELIATGGGTRTSPCHPTTRLDRACLDKSFS